MELYLKVRLACDGGMSQREASRHFGISRDTVRKMMTYSVPPGYRRRAPVRRPKLEAFIPIIDGWLEADRTVPRKQRQLSSVGVDIDSRRYGIPFEDDGFGAADLGGERTFSAKMASSTKLCDSAMTEFVYTGSTISRSSNTSMRRSVHSCRSSSKDSGARRRKMSADRRASKCSLKQSPILTTRNTKT